MREICLLGAWLGDVVNTELRVRDRSQRPWVKYVAVKNYSYNMLFTMLGWDRGTKSFDWALSNICEHLMWLALEEDRCEWILGILREASRRNTTAFRSTLAVGHVT